MAMFGFGQAVEAPEKRKLLKTNKCFILNNTFKGKRGPLLGYEVDEKNITDTFTWLNFDVDTKKNLSGVEMKKLFSSWYNADYSDDECFVGFILTHGGDYKEKKVMWGEDWKPVYIDSFIRHMNDVKSLYNKPKLIFVQACRGDEDSEIINVNRKADGEETHNVVNAGGNNNEGEEPSDDDTDGKVAGRQESVEKAKEADMFIYYSTSSDKYSYVLSDAGSFFVSELCLVLQAYGGDYPLNSIVTKVNEFVAKKVVDDNVQACESHNHLTYDLFFSPITLTACGDVRASYHVQKKAKFFAVCYQGGEMSALYDFFSGNKAITHKAFRDDFDAAVEYAQSNYRAAIVYDAATERTMYSKACYTPLEQAEQELLGYASKECPYE